jgi:hypothetical protein
MKNKNEAAKQPAKYVYEFWDDGDWLLMYDEKPYDSAEEARQAGIDAGYEKVRVSEEGK